MSAKRRVVVTGLGMITPLGLNVEQTWQNILAGKSGIKLIDDMDMSQQRVRFAGTIHNFNPENHGISNKEARRYDVFIQYGLIAAAEAIKDSKLEMSNEEQALRSGVLIGSGIGGITSIERNAQTMFNSGPTRISPYFIPSAIINMAAGSVSIKNNFKGPNFGVVSACTTGAHNIGIGFRMIQYGDADVIVAGGTEKASTMLGIGGFAAARALSTRNDSPEKASRPWDKDRDGFVLSDGSGVLVLEEYEHAKKRGAKIYAELVGFGMSADAYHDTLPDEQGLGFKSSMLGALKDAKLTAKDIDYINAHGTSTPAGDIIEARSIEETLYHPNLLISSTKSMTGHMLGATGAAEAIFSILAIRNKIAPPTINLDNLDPECPNLDFVPHKAKPHKISYALSNSFGFGGTNASLIFSEFS